jgi:dihydropteroate synthase
VTEGVAATTRTGAGAVAPAPVLRLGTHRLPVGARVHVVGILNVTPDSFSDGGAFLDPERAAVQAHAMAVAGADLIDIGGESSRPGAAPVPAVEERRRILPVLRRLARELAVPLSVDTRKPEVAEAALAEGAVLINDPSGLAAGERMAALAARAGAGLVVMHTRGTPETMMRLAEYADLVGEVRRFLAERAALAEAAGVPREGLVVDPGLGFAKAAGHTLALLRDLAALTDLGYPVLVGPSRKAFIGRILGLPERDRLEGTAAAVAAAVLHGARLIRVHDVLPMVRVIRVAEAIRRGQA